MLPAPQPAPATAVASVNNAAIPESSRVQDVSLASVARAATLGVQVYPSVASADFSITGTLQDMHLAVSLCFAPSPDNQRIKDEISTELIPGLESILGASFARTTLDYSVTEPTLTALPVAAA